MAKRKRKTRIKKRVKKFVKRAKKVVGRAGRKIKRGAKPVGKRVKRGAKRLGKGAVRVAKSDPGRAGIGAGVGALALGPVGAVAGAAVGLATRKRSNPEPTIKVASVVGSLMLDYHRASPYIESVSAHSLRGQRVPLSLVIRAREDLKRLQKMQSPTEREQIADIVDALSRLIIQAGRTRTYNPVRAFSLDAQVKAIRQSKAKKGAVKIASDSKIYDEVKGKSLASKLRKINPGSMLDGLVLDYRKTKKRFVSLSMKPGSAEKELSRAQKRMDDAENKLLLYADARKISPQELRVYLDENKIKRNAKAPSRNPLKHIPKGAGLRKIKKVVSDNISIESAAGKPQNQAVAIAISSARRDADRVGGPTAKLIRAEFPRGNPKYTRPEKPRKKKRKARNQPYHRERLGGGKRNPDSKFSNKSEKLFFDFCEKRTSLNEILKKISKGTGKPSPASLKTARSKFKEAGKSLNQLVNHLSKYKKAKISREEVILGVEVWCEAFRNASKEIEHERKRLGISKSESKQIIKEVSGGLRSGNPKLTKIPSRIKKRAT